MINKLLKKYVGRGGQGGFVYLLALIMAVALFIALTGVLSLGTINLSSVRRSISDDNALYAAESGADNAVFQINADNSYTGTNTTCPIGTMGSNPVTLYSNATEGKATYENCVAAGSISNEKIVYSVGKLYRRVTDTSPISTRKVKVIVEGSLSGGYSAISGPGGLILANSASITNGPIAVGGTLTMSGNAKIGSAASPIAVSVANERCPSPADATYPLVCATGTQPNPISMAGSAHVYGAVTANGQTNTYATFLTNTGLVSGTATAPSLPVPTRTSTTSSLTGAQASCSGTQSITWPANVKITGNVTTGNSCTITVSGNAWITGNLSLGNASIFQVASSVATAPLIMVDGSSGISVTNSAHVSTNASNVGFQFVTYYSTAACSPTCSSVTGTSLKSSQTITTISLANAGLGSGSTFEALWTELDVSNGGTIGGVMGQTISMTGNSNIAFNTSGVGGAWSYDVRYYEVQ